MTEIIDKKITIHGGAISGAWHFYGTRFFVNKLEVYVGICCDGCNKYKLDSGYVYIIKQLKQSGLLDKNYPCLCCKCFIEDRLKSVGFKHANRNFR